MKTIIKTLQITLFVGICVLSGVLGSQAQIKHVSKANTETTAPLAATQNNREGATTGTVNGLSRVFGGPPFLNVTKTADTDDGICDADCSLREAVALANANSYFADIYFPIPSSDPNCVNGVCTVQVTAGEIAITGTFAISGPGANALIISGTNNSRIFFSNAATLTIRNVTLTGGNGVGAGVSGDGGAIYADGGTLVLQYVNITANSVSGNGGGVVFEGSSNNQVINSTFSDNHSGLHCGGFGIQIGTLTVTNTTISGNTSAQVGGGFCNHSGTVTLRNNTVTGNTAVLGGGFFTDSTTDIGNTIVAGNTAGADADIYYNNGTFTSAGFNLIGDDSGTGSSFSNGVSNDIVGTNAAPVDARLAPLGDYGGPTPTCALMLNSPAVNSGNSAETSDQRLYTRVDATDIGAFERNISLDQGTLPNGNKTVAYSQQLTATIVEPTFSAEKNAASRQLSLPINFSLTPDSGQLPTGLTLAADGLLSGTPTVVGTFDFIVQATDSADGMSGAQKYTVMVFAPTFANVGISGKVSNAAGMGVRNAQVILTEADGKTSTTVTSSTGSYTIANIPAGQTIIIEVVSKQYKFATQIITINEDLTEVNFTAVTVRTPLESRFQ